MSKKLEWIINIIIKGIDCTHVCHGWRKKSFGEHFLHISNPAPPIPNWFKCHLAYFCGFFALPQNRGAVTLEAGSAGIPGILVCPANCRIHHPLDRLTLSYHPDTHVRTIFQRHVFSFKFLIPSVSDFVNFPPGIASVEVGRGEWLNLSERRGLLFGDYSFCELSSVIIRY